jgi:hypothetical protein
MHTKEVDLDQQIGNLTIRNKLEHLTRDNPNPVYRPPSKAIFKVFIPAATKAINTRAKELPPHLLELELRYKARAHWQKSNYVWEALRKMLHAFSDTLHYVEKPVISQEELATWVPVDRLKTTTYGFTTEGSDLSKSAGLPKFGSKRDQLNGALQYAEVIKQSGTLKSMYPIFPGFRTQQSPPDDPKVRGINMIPISTWVLERECWPYVIARAKADWNKPEAAVNYFPPEQTWKQFGDLAARGQTAVVLDATLYDTTVHANENEASAMYFIPDYEHRDLLVEYMNKAEILMPQGEMIERNGGKTSGGTDTNFTDSWTNIGDIVQSLGPILRYLVGYIVNGDDIILVFSTVVRKENISRLSRESRRNINPDKSDIKTDTAWFSKLYLDDRLDGPTKPLFLIANSLSFKERESDPITSSKEYVAIASTSILAPLEYHPFGDEFRSIYWKRCDKYHIQSFGRQELIPAMKRYLSSNSWKVEHGILPEDPGKAVDAIRQSWAAEASA